MASTSAVTAQISNLHGASNWKKTIQSLPFAGILGNMQNLYETVKKAQSRLRLCGCKKN